MKVESIRGRDVLSLEELSTSEIEGVLEVAEVLKREVRQGVYRELLVNRTLAMLFEKPSTRTRVSFEVAMSQLGGHVIDLPASKTQLTRGETVEDTGKVLSRYVDAIVARVYDHNNLKRLSDAATVPVINGLSNLFHPCQVLGDLLTLKEVKKHLKGLKLAYVGDGNNVANSLLLGASKMGVHISVATPSRYRPLREAIEMAKVNAKETVAKIELTEDPRKAVREADAVYTDTFVSAGSEEDREKRLKVFLPRYQVDSELMKEAKPDAVVLHCLPAYRGEEITGAVIDGPQSVVWDQAENRLHAQKAILLLLLLAKEELPW